MLRIVSFASLALGFGAGLALASLAAGAPTGWIGASALLGWALIARRRWARVRQTTGLEPGALEQIVWLRTAGVAMLLGHLAVALAHARIDLHVGSGNSLAIDSWTMTLVLLAAALLFRHERHERDERHAQISAHGVQAGYTCALLSMSVLSLFLAFAPEPVRASLTQWRLANLLIALMLGAYLAQLITQLIIYRPRARDETPHG